MTQSIALAVIFLAGTAAAEVSTPTAVSEPLEATREAAPATAAKSAKWNEQQAFKKAFGKAVEGYISAEGAKNNGKFTVEGHDLILVRVHKHKIESAGADEYAALADFKGAASEKTRARVLFTAVKAGDTFVVSSAVLKSITGDQP